MAGPRPPPLAVCPSPPEHIAFPTYWYRFYGNDNFLICTKCYEEKLRSTPLRSFLICVKQYYSSAYCDFGTPRIDALLRQAWASGDFEPLRSFAQIRITVKYCPGMQQVRGRDFNWFAAINSDIPGFISCQACYEDVILGSRLAHLFQPYYRQEHAVDGSWSCDIAKPFLKHSFQACASRGDWHGFVRAVRRRFSARDCPGKAIPERKNLGKWYNTVRPSPLLNFTFCEACYLDRAGWMPYASQQFGPQKVDHLQAKNYTCGFSLDSVDVCSQILLAKDFGKWHNIMSQILPFPECKHEGILDGEWYMLVDPHDGSETLPNFEMCVSCHFSFNESADFGHLFRRVSYLPGEIRMCDFNIGSPAYSEYIAKWNQMYFTRDTAPFVDFVSRFSSLSRCQIDRDLENAPWYGDEDASLFICPSCFEVAVRGTQFASAFKLQNTVLADKHHCCLYSPRMREKYAAACETGSLDGLLSFAVHREQVYQETVPQILAFAAERPQTIGMVRIPGRSNSTARDAVNLTSSMNEVLNFPLAYTPSVPASRINQDEQGRKVANDHRIPMIEKMEARWREVE